MELAPKLGEATSKSTLAPLLLLFLRDEIVDVRLNILKRMEYLAQWMSSFEAILLPAIADLARDLQWRVREAVILSIPALAGSLVRRSRLACVFDKWLLWCTPPHPGATACLMLSASSGEPVLPGAPARDLHECLHGHGR